MGKTNLQLLDFLVLYFFLFFCKGISHLADNDSDDKSDKIEMTMLLMMMGMFIIIIIIVVINITNELRFIAVHFNTQNKAYITDMKHLTVQKCTLSKN